MILDDGFGNRWDDICPECGQKLEIVRPGKVQCTGLDNCRKSICCNAPIIKSENSETEFYICSLCGRFCNGYG